MVAWNWLDWTLSVIEVASVAAAALKGFIRELIALASLIAAVAVAALGYRRAAGWFEELTRSHEIALGAGFLTLFVAVLILGALVSFLAKKLLKTAGLEWFDRLLGALFGLIRGAGIACVLLMVLVAFEIKVEAVRQSVLAPYAVNAARPIAAAMPGELRDQFHCGLEKLKQALIQQDKKAPKE